jgi:hypothetical protein
VCHFEAAFGVGRTALAARLQVAEADARAADGLFLARGL